MDAGDLVKISRAYRQWLRTPEAMELKFHKPLEYITLHKYPDNFPRVREAFHIVWITEKMTK